MIFVVDVKEDKRAVLGAVTHTDGSARVQTVSKKNNETFWRLIHAFKSMTGIPILLNTSFNNNAEPIVDSVEDAMVCYLTTKLDYLVVGDYLVAKKEPRWQDYLTLKPTLAPHITLHHVKQSDSSGTHSTSLYIQNTFDPKFKIGLSPEIYRILCLADGERKLKDIMVELGETDDRRIQAAVFELIELWAQRQVMLKA
jgi:carbamoyltransferase